MIRFSRFLAAMVMAFLIGLMAPALAPARAATPPAGSALAVEAGSRATDTVQYYSHRRVYRSPHHTRPHYRNHIGYHRPIYRHRHRHYGRPVYYPRPVYRRCVKRPRWVWTPHGYVRRWVVVCR